MNLALHVYQVIVRPITRGERVLEIKCKLLWNSGPGRPPFITVRCLDVAEHLKKSLNLLGRDRAGVDFWVST
jgi:hypothetical protein